jgi:hypothetical protein
MLPDRSLFGGRIHEATIQPCSWGVERACGGVNLMEILRPDAGDSIHDEDIGIIEKSTQTF